MRVQAVKRYRVVLLWLPLWSLLVLNACSISERTSYTDSEGVLPKDVLERIKDNRTSKAWVVSHLGDPFAIDRIEYSTNDVVAMHEVYTYRLVRSKIRSGHVLFFFRAGAREDNIDYFHIVFSDQVVKKSWMDQYAGVQMGVRENKKLVLVMPEGDQAIDLEKSNDEDGFDWKLPVLKKWFGVSKKAPEEQYSNAPPELVEDPESAAPTAGLTRDRAVAEEGDMDSADMEEENNVDQESEEDSAVTEPLSEEEMMFLDEDATM